MARSGRNEATARGAVFCLQQASTVLNMPLAGARVAIQGYGNVGSIAAQLLAAEGANIVAVSDSTGGIHNPPGSTRPRWAPGSRSTGPWSASPARPR